MRSSVLLLPVATALDGVPDAARPPQRDGLRLRLFSFHVPLAQIIVDEKTHLTLLFLDWITRMVEEDIGRITWLDGPPSRFLRPGLC